MQSRRGSIVDDIEIEGLPRLLPFVELAGDCDVDDFLPFCARMREKLTIEMKKQVKHIFRMDEREGADREDLSGEVGWLLRLLLGLDGGDFKRDGGPLTPVGSDLDEHLSANILDWEVFWGYLKWEQRFDEYTLALEHEHADMLIMKWRRWCRQYLDKLHIIIEQIRDSFLGLISELKKLVDLPTESDPLQLQNEKIILHGAVERAWQCQSNVVGLVAFLGGIADMEVMLKVPQLLLLVIREEQECIQTKSFCYALMDMTYTLGSLWQDSRRGVTKQYSVDCIWLGGQEKNISSLMAQQCLMNLSFFGIKRFFSDFSPTLNRRWYRRLQWIDCPPDSLVDIERVRACIGSIDAPWIVGDVAERICRMLEDLQYPEAMLGLLNGLIHLLLGSKREPRRQRGRPSQILSDLLARRLVGIGRASSAPSSPVGDEVLSRLTALRDSLQEQLSLLMKGAQGRDFSLRSLFLERSSQSGGECWEIKKAMATIYKWMASFHWNERDDSRMAEVFMYCACVFGVGDHETIEDVPWCDGALMACLSQDVAATQKINVDGQCLFATEQVIIKQSLDVVMDILVDGDADFARSVRAVRACLLEDFSTIDGDETRTARRISSVRLDVSFERATPTADWKYLEQWVGCSSSGSSNLLLDWSVYQRAMFFVHCHYWYNAIVAARCRLGKGMALVDSLVFSLHLQECMKLMVKNNRQASTAPVVMDALVQYLWFVVVILMKLGAQVCPAWSDGLVDLLQLGQLPGEFGDYLERYSQSLSHGFSTERIDLPDGLQGFKDPRRVPGLRFFEVSPVAAQLIHNRESPCPEIENFFCGRALG